MPTVADIMSKDVMTVQKETPIGEAAKKLLDNHINGLPVVDEQGRVVGILCQSDLITQQKNLPLPTVFTILDGFIPLSSMSQMEKQVKKISATTVEHAMTPDPVTITATADINEAASLMVDKNFHTLPVVDGETLVGVLGKEDVLKTLL